MVLTSSSQRDEVFGQFHSRVVRSFLPKSSDVSVVVQVFVELVLPRRSILFDFKKNLIFLIFEIFEKI